MSLLEASGSNWAAFGAAIRAFRALLPIRLLSDFGFSDTEGFALDEPDTRLRKVGGGVEAWAFEAAEDGSIYKFFWPHAEKSIGSEFKFDRGAETLLQAAAQPGDYRGLLEKLLIILALGGMATEVLAITPQGILVVKQARGEGLPQGEDMSRDLPGGLIEIPSRFLRADRDHPRLHFLGVAPFLVGDLHARNFVRAADGTLRVIDLVAGAWPADKRLREPLVEEWIGRIRADPLAPALPAVPDDEL